MNTKHAIIYANTFRKYGVSLTTFCEASLKCSKNFDALSFLLECGLKQEQATILADKIYEYVLLSKIGIRNGNLDL